MTDREFLEHVAIELISERWPFDGANVVLQLKSIAPTLDRGQETLTEHAPMLKLSDMTLKSKNFVLR